MTKEALKLALEALETCGDDEWHTDDDFGMMQTYDADKVNLAITAIKGALAQPAQEPVIGTKTWFEDGKLLTQNLTAKEVYLEPAQEPVAWAVQRYFADGKEFLYPHAGDPLPPMDTKVLLLTRGGICVTGYWGQHWCLGWLPLPKRNMDKEDQK